MQKNIVILFLAATVTLASCGSLIILICREELMQMIFLMSLHV